MAIVVNVAGLATVSVDATGLGAVVPLGRTRNGVQYTEEGYYGDVPGDEFGGDEGPPVDVQYFGEVHRIRCEFTKYDSVVADAVAAKVRGATHGQPAASGTLYFGGNKFMRVRISTTNGHVRDYNAVIPRSPVELNVGTKFSTTVFEFEAYLIPGNDAMFTTT